MKYLLVWLQEGSLTRCQSEIAPLWLVYMTVTGVRVQDAILAALLVLAWPNTLIFKKYDVLSYDLCSVVSYLLVILPLTGMQTPFGIHSAPLA